jgi:DNA-binding transcriptional MerR regulator
LPAYRIVVLSDRLSADREPTFTVSELAERSRTPLSSIKFYLREGLLPAGDLEASHRAFYGELHVRRLDLIRVLRDVAGLTVPAIRDIFTLLDGEGGRDLSSVIARVIDALGRRESLATGRDAVAARREVFDLLHGRGVRVRRNAKAVVDLADALVGLRRTLGSEVPVEAIIPYLDAMCALAEKDFEATRHLVKDAASAALGATYGTVLWEPILILLRRIAHEHVAAKAFGNEGPRARRRG